MVRHFLPAALVAVLSGCAPLGIAPTVIGDHDGVSERMFAIAARFEQDRREGGMAGVIGGVETCYAMATSPVIQIYGLRDCLVLDYVAYRTDVAAGRSFNGMRLPFFEDRVAVQRWGHYGPLAQFDTPQRLLNYLNDANGVVQADLAQINAAPVVNRGGMYSGLAKHF